MKNTRKETNYEKLEHLKKLSGQDEIDCRNFINFIYTYLDGCGYFMSDYNIHNLPRPDDWINYRDRDFGTWLLDMALQYNMEQGMEYKCELIEDRYEKGN